MNDNEKLDRFKILVKGFNECLNEFAYDEEMIQKLQKLSQIQYQMQDVLLEDEDD